MSEAAGPSSTAAAAPAPSDLWTFRGRSVDLSRRTFLLGVLNVTPDSFSDGGLHATAEAAVEAGLAMAEAGADGIDVGGESTRPGRADTMTAEVEIGRTLAVVRELRRRLPAGVAVSIDTYRAETARAALDAGADIVNDITALRHAPEIADLAAAHGAGLILMHMLGEPETMQRAPAYKGDVLVEIRDLLRDRMAFARSRGVAGSAIAVDPGLGFGKTVAHNVRILAGLEYLRLLGRPVCVGASRKGFLGRLATAAASGAGEAGWDTADPGEPADREAATLAAHTAAVMNGATIIRTHDVKAARRALAVADALRG